MRDRLGAFLQVAGLVLMPLALVEGFREGGTFGNEIVIGFAGFLLIVIGRGLRSATPPK